MSGHRELGVELIRCNAIGDADCVQKHATTIGHVQKVYLPSHIRRGRAQASPHWIAADRDGTPYDEPPFQRRVDAIAAVIVRRDEREGR